MENINKTAEVHRCKSHSLTGKGPSSFHMHDQETVMRAMRIKKGDSILDLGCGAGDYSVHAAIATGETGKVYALDIWEGSIEFMREKTESLNLSNVKGTVCSILEPLPVEDSSIDLALIATVLHTINFKENGIKLLDEVRRVLKPDARLITIDCKKEETSFGPPMHMRLSPEEIIEKGEKCGFRMEDYYDLGYTYMITFMLRENNVL